MTPPMHFTKAPSALALTFLLLAFVASPPSMAKAEVPDEQLPNIDAPVTDLADALSDEAESALTAQLLDHRTATGVQLAVLLVQTTEGEPIEDYSLRVASLWRGGSATRDEGALYVLAVGDRRQRLEVGYGLEDRIPDGRAARILSGAVPALQRSDYEGATQQVVRGVIDASGDMEPLPETRERHAIDLTRFVVAPVYGVIFFISTLIGFGVRRRRSKAHDEDLALGVISLSSGPSVLWLPVYVLAIGTVAAAFGLGWFHYLAAFVGVFAGMSFAWDCAFITVHYLFMVSIFAFVAGVAGSVLFGVFELGVLLSFVAQLLITVVYGAGAGAGATQFSSRGATPAKPRREVSFYDQVRAPTRKPHRERAQRADPFPKASMFGGSSSSSSSGGGFGRTSSSSSSSSSSSYKGGGGKFGGGGASSSW